MTLHTDTPPPHPLRRIAEFALGTLLVIAVFFVLPGLVMILLHGMMGQ